MGAGSSTGGAATGSGVGVGADNGAAPWFGLAALEHGLVLTGQQQTGEGMQVRGNESLGVTRPIVTNELTQKLCTWQRYGCQPLAMNLLYSACLPARSPLTPPSCVVHSTPTVQW